MTALLVLCVPMQAAAERQLREQGQLPSATAAAEAAAGTSEAAAGPEATANGDAPPEGDGAAGGAAGGSKKGKVVSAKDKEEALLKAKRKEIMERAGKAVCCTWWKVSFLADTLGPTPSGLWSRHNRQDRGQHLLMYCIFVLPRHPRPAHSNTHMHSPPRPLNFCCCRHH